MIIQKVVLPVLFLFGPVLASAQIGGGGSGAAVSTPPRRFSGRASFPGSLMPFSPITGAPFSGVRETEHTQTLADGTHISRKMLTQKVWRDADGRMRTERPMIMGPYAAEDSPAVVEIVDPVAGYRYTLDTQGKVAHRVAIAQRPAAPPPPQNQAAAGTIVRQGSMGGSVAPGNAVAAGQPAPGGGVIGSFSTMPRRIQSQHESLGTKTIDGLAVNGTRFTITIPAGDQGNDRPISTVTETWTSPELREMIESTSSDPRSGESITRLNNIDRNNPDPGLFQVPADYEIVDEQGPFTINFHQ